MAKNMPESTTSGVALAPEISPLAAIATDKLMLRLWQSGRELFHSNMLAYLIEHQEHGSRLLDYLVPLPKAVLASTQENDSGWVSRFHLRVRREYMHLDLWIIALPRLDQGDEDLSPDTDEYWIKWATRLEARGSESIPWQLIVVENKFKSLPRWDQLKEYSAKIAREEHSLSWVRNEWMNADSDSTEQEGEPAEAKEDEADTDGSWESQKVRHHCQAIILQPIAAESAPDAHDASGANQDNEQEWAKIITDAQSTKRVPKRAEISWKLKTWNEIARRIATAEPPASGERHEAQPPVCRNGLETEFVAAYQKMLLHSCALLEEVRTNVQTNFAAVDRLRQQAFPLRLHDLVDKWRFEWLAEQVKTKIGATDHNRVVATKGKNTKVEGFEITPACDTTQSSKSFWIQIHAFFSRGTGGIDLNIHCLTHPREITLGLQLQGNLLKVYLTQPIAGDEARSAAVPVVNKMIDVLNEKLAHLRLSAVDRDGDALGRYHQSVHFISARSSVAAQQKTVQLSTKAGSFFYLKKVVWTTDALAAAVRAPDVLPQEYLWQGRPASSIADDLCTMVNALLENWDRCISP
ncbi:MAG TPA: hypothetical protein VFF81_12090 [Noviherbaspirillum sp.]|nr:hypothetical protein [Noviherbaspirillum sp.]